MEPKATEPIPGIQIQAPQVPPPAPQNLPVAPQQPTEPPVPVPLRPKPERVYEPVTYSVDNPGAGKFRRGLGKVVTVFIILIVILVLATAAGAAYLYVSSGDNLVSDGLKGIDNSPKVHVAVRLTPEYDDAKYQGTYIEVTSEVDRSGGAIPKVQVSLDLSSTGYEASVEAKYIHPILYGRITRVPDQYKTYINDYFNKWYSVSLDAFVAMSEERGYNVASSTLKRTSPSELFEKLKTAGVLEDATFMGLKKTDRGWAREYSILINKESLVNLIVTNKEFAKLKPSEIEKIKESVRESMDKISFQPLLVRTGLVAGELHEIVFAVDAVGSGPMPGLKGITVSLTNDESQTNFVVSAPQDAISLDQMILSAVQRSKDMEKQSFIRARLSNVRTPAELYYDKGNSYLSMCTKDASLKESFDAIKAAGSPVTCRSTKLAYLIAAKLPQVGNATSTSYFCIDSVGTERSLPKVPAGYVCK